MIVDRVVAILKKMTIFRGKAGGETFMNKYVNYLRPVFIMSLLYCSVLIPVEGFGLVCDFR